MIRDYLQWSPLPNGLVMLYEREGRIAGVVEISVYDDYIAVEMLGKNVLVDATRVGTKLMSLVENICKQIGINEIRL